MYRIACLFNGVVKYYSDCDYCPFGPIFNQHAQPFHTKQAAERMLAKIHAFPILWGEIVDLKTAYIVEGMK